MKLTPPRSLLGEIFQLIEASHVERRTHRLPDGTEKIVEWHALGSDKWIRRAKERGVLTPMQLLAVIHFVIFDFSVIDEEKIVSDWSEAISEAVGSGLLTARDPASLLPIKNLQNESEWIVSLDDSDAFVASKGMMWTCSEVVSHIFAETFGIASATDMPAVLQDSLKKLEQENVVASDKYVREGHTTKRETAVATPAHNAPSVAITRKVPQGGGALTRLIWLICYEFSEAGGSPTAGKVMLELKIRAASPDPRQKLMLQWPTEGGVQYEDANGDPKELDTNQLKSRINVWKVAQG